MNQTKTFTHNVKVKHCVGSANLTTHFKSNNILISSVDPFLTPPITPTSQPLRTQTNRSEEILVHFYAEPAGIFLALILPIQLQLVGKFKASVL